MNSKKLAFALVLTTHGLCFAMPDDDLFAKARAAVEANDCQSALASLDQTSPRFQTRTSFLLLAGMVHQCLHHPDKAYFYFKKYDDLKPGNETVRKKIGEVLYEKELVDKRSQQLEAERKRIVDEQQRKHTALMQKGQALVGEWTGRSMGGFNKGTGCRSKDTQSDFTLVLDTFDANTNSGTGRMRWERSWKAVIDLNTMAAYGLQDGEENCKKKVTGSEWSQTASFVKEFKVSWSMASNDSVNAHFTNGSCDGDLCNDDGNFDKTLTIQYDTILRYDFDGFSRPSVDFRKR
jgi:hypothetical protein